MTESISVNDFASNHIHFPNNEKQNLLIQEENLGYFNSFHPSVTTSKFHISLFIFLSFAYAPLFY
jgi:hypothetical protein